MNECDVCNRRFAISGNFVICKKTHTGAKPYECDVCNKRFTQSSDLKGIKEHILEPNLMHVMFVTKDLQDQPT